MRAVRRALIRFVNGSADGLRHAEGHPGRPGQTGSLLIPGAQRDRKSVQLIGISVEPAARRTQRRQPRFGRGQPGRRASAARGRERRTARQRFARGHVNHRGQRPGEQLVRIFATQLGTADRWHRPYERPHGQGIVPLQERPPGSNRAGFVAHQSRQYPAPAHQFPRERRHLGQIADRCAVADVLCEGGQSGEGRSRVKHYDGNAPRQQRRPRLSGRTRGDPDQLRRVERSHAQ